MKKTIAFTLAALLSVTYVSSSFAEKGVGEKAGEAIDDAAEKVKDKTAEIADNVKDGDPILHEKGAGEKAGEKIDKLAGVTGREGGAEAAGKNIDKHARDLKEAATE